MSAKTYVSTTFYIERGTEWTGCVISDGRAAGVRPSLGVAASIHTSDPAALRELADALNSTADRMDTARAEALDKAALDKMMNKIEVAECAA